MKKLRAALIGAGFTGAAHVEAIRRLGYVDVVAIACPRDAQEKAKELYIPNSYADYMEMIDGEKLDCVHICTPNSLHFDMAMYAMERGIHVICEKPLAIQVEQAQALCEYAEDHHLVAAVNFSSRMSPQVQQMKSLVQSGEVGDVFTVHGSYLQDWLHGDTDWNWRLDTKLAGSTRAMADLGAQWMDTVEYVLGQKITAVIGEFETFYNERNQTKKQGSDGAEESGKWKKIHTEDCCTMMFRLENGAKGTCIVSQIYAGRKNQQIISIGGSACSLHWDSALTNQLWIGKKDGYNRQIVRDQRRVVLGEAGGYSDGFSDVFKENFSKIYQVIMDKNQDNVDFATFEDGYRAMVLCEKIVESAKKHCWISVE